jgi:hypothetical protein
VIVARPVIDLADLAMVPGAQPDLRHGHGRRALRHWLRIRARARAEEISALKGFLRDASEIDTLGLDQEDSITLDMLQVVCRIQLREHELNPHHFEALDQLAGPQGLPGDLSRFQRLDTPSGRSADPPVELFPIPGQAPRQHARRIAAGRTARGRGRAVIEQRAARRDRR